MTMPAKERKHRAIERHKNMLIRKLTEGQLLLLMDLDKVELARMLIDIYKTGAVGTHWTGMNMNELEQELTVLESDLNGTD